MCCLVTSALSRGKETSGKGQGRTSDGCKGCVDHLISAIDPDPHDLAEPGRLKGDGLFEAHLPDECISERAEIGRGRVAPVVLRLSLPKGRSFAVCGRSFGTDSAADGATIAQSGLVA